MLLGANYSIRGTNKVSFNHKAYWEIYAVQRIRIRVRCWIFDSVLLIVFLSSVLEKDLRVVKNTLE